MKIEIAMGYDGAETQAAAWAGGEDSIDFRKEIEAAARCTAAFAAQELKEHLEKTLTEADVSVVSAAGGQCFSIGLVIKDIACDGAGFSLEPDGCGITIVGEGRKGLLYGAYEFLRMNGWRWHTPGKAGEIAPPFADGLKLPDAGTRYAPSMPLGRGFDFESLSMESRDLLLWMARNRLDLASYRPMTGQYSRKLGMSFKNGGHIFEDILNPGRIMPSGKTLWEEHEQWYGLPADGIRKKETALRTQFCVSDESLLGFLCKEVLGLAAGRWREADRIDIWGFDTWGSGCCCDGCRRLGNASDRMLHFLSRLRQAAGEAALHGRLDHAVRFVMCAYEGTSTLEAPTQPIPANLVSAGDYVVYYPILRCYAHDCADGTCSRNIPYDAALRGWLSCSPSLPVMVGEYYNVSKFEDLPLLFTGRITNDLPGYHALGVGGMTYMHIPMTLWGMRTLTQLLYAQMAWDAGTDATAFVEEYFALRYGPHAGKMAEAYAAVEQAWAYSASWRSWGEGSVLTQLQKWDGGKPSEPLKTDSHFKTAQGAARSGRGSIRLLSRAMELVNEALREVRTSLRASASPGQAAAVNPVEQRLLAAQGSYEKRIAEDRRLLCYGLDTMTIMTRLVEYHSALYEGDDAAAFRLWRGIERLADRLDMLIAPIGYEWPGPGLESLDVLTRTQTGELVARIRSKRYD